MSKPQHSHYGRPYTIVYFLGLGDAFTSFKGQAFFTWFVVYMLSLLTLHDTIEFRIRRIN